MGGIDDYDRSPEERSGSATAATAGNREGVGADFLSNVECSNCEVRVLLSVLCSCVLCSLAASLMAHRRSLRRRTEGMLYVVADVDLVGVSPPVPVTRAPHSTTRRREKTCDAVGVRSRVDDGDMSCRGPSEDAGVGAARPIGSLSRRRATQGAMRGRTGRRGVLDLPLCGMCWGSGEQYLVVVP